VLFPPYLKIFFIEGKKKIEILEVKKMNPAQIYFEILGKALQNNYIPKEWEKSLINAYKELGKKRKEKEKK